MVQAINKYVINLPSRLDRLDSVQKELPYLFKDATFRLVSGVVHPNPMIGIAKAHLNCIEIAKEQSLPYVLIMEDDVCFPAKAKTLAYVKNAFNHLPEDWDILLGGLYESDGFVQYNEYWNQTKEFCGLHFYIVNEKAYDIILTYDNLHHIDRWMNMGGKRLKCYVTRKMFAIQTIGFSDNAKKKTDHSDKLLKYDILK